MRGNLLGEMQSRREIAQNCLPDFGGFAQAIYCGRISLVHVGSSKPAWTTSHYRYPSPSRSDPSRVRPAPLRAAARRETATDTSGAQIFVVSKRKTADSGADDNITKGSSTCVRLPSSSRPPRSWAFRPVSTPILSAHSPVQPRVRLCRTRWAATPLPARLSAARSARPATTWAQPPVTDTCRLSGRITLSCRCQGFAALAAVLHSEDRN